MLLSYDMIHDETYHFSYTGIAPADEKARFSGVSMDCLGEPNPGFIRYSNWYDEVLSAALSGRHPLEVLNLAVKMLDNLVAIIDTASRTLMYAGEFHGSIEGSIWKSVLEDGFSLYEAYLQNFGRNSVRSMKEGRH